MKDLKKLRILLITDGRGDADRILQVVKKAFDNGVRAFQVREHFMSDQDQYALLQKLSRFLPRKESLLFVNDRVDLCLAAKLDGVQLGYRSCSISQARSLLGKERWIGVSTHQLAEIREAHREKADFALFGPVYPTPSKVDWVEPQGIELLFQAVKETLLPVIAVGGIEPENVPEVLSTGCTGIAVIRAIFQDQSASRISKKVYQS